MHLYPPSLCLFYQESTRSFLRRPYRGSMKGRGRVASSEHREAQMAPRLYAATCSWGLAVISARQVGLCARRRPAAATWPWACCRPTQESSSPPPPPPPLPPSSPRPPVGTSLMADLPYHTSHTVQGIQLVDMETTKQLVCKYKIY